MSKEFLPTELQQKEMDALKLPSELSSKLLPQQTLFIARYFENNLNVSKSAKQVGYNVGYAYQLLQNENVREAIDYILNNIQYVGIASWIETMTLLTNIARDMDTLDTVLPSGNVVESRVNTRERVKALELLGKYHGILSERHVFSTDTQIIVDVLDAENAS
ncbi:terminase small subunit [Bacillus thuringiensis]